MATGFSSLRVHLTRNKVDKMSSPKSFNPPAPPVPGGADRLLGEDEAGDVDHVEEEVAHEIRCLGAHQLQAIAEPVGGKVTSTKCRKKGTKILN